MRFQLAEVEFRNPCFGFCVVRIQAQNNVELGTSLFVIAVPGIAFGLPNQTRGVLFRQTVVFGHSFGFCHLFGVSCFFGDLVVGRDWCAMARVFTIGFLGSGRPAQGTALGREVASAPARAETGELVGPLGWGCQTLPSRDGDGEKE